MIVRTEILEPFDTYHEYLGYAPESSLFFDIETTGFSPSLSFLFLIGAVYRQEGVWHLTQWFAEELTEQPVILDAFFRLAARFHTLVQFNGLTFDLPFLREKAAAFHLPCPLEDMDCLDLYQRFRPLKKLLGPPRMNQGTLESYVGWLRQDTLSGKAMVSLYQKYTASREAELAEQMLLHNHDDMVGMTRILRLAPVMMLFDGIIEKAADKTPAALPASGGEPFFLLSLELSAPLPAPLDVKKGAYQLRAEKKKGVLSIPFCHATLFHFFPDYRNYYFLPLENQVIHKSVAAYVDKEYRTPARPENCCVPKTGVFLPQPRELFSPVFQVEYRDPALFFEYREEFSLQDRDLFLYARAILQFLRK